MSPVREAVKFNDYISALKKDTAETIHFNGVKLDINKVQQILSAIPENSCVKIFDFSCCNMGDTELALLFNGLKKIKGSKIEDIDISNNKAYGYSTYEIGSYIKKSKTLKSINLYGNNLKNKDVMHLGACVAQSESVEYLSIANNKDVTDFAIRPFLSLLRSSSNPLRKMEVFGTAVSSDTKDLIKMAVAKKEKLLLNGNKLEEFRNKNRATSFRSRSGGR